MWAYRGLVLYCWHRTAFYSCLLLALMLSLGFGSWMLPGQLPRPSVRSEHTLIGPPTLNVGMDKGGHEAYRDAQEKRSVEPATSGTCNFSETSSVRGFPRLIQTITWAGICNQVRESHFQSCTERVRTLERQMRGADVRGRTVKVCPEGAFAGHYTLAAVVPGLRRDGFKVILDENLLTQQV